MEHRRSSQGLTISFPNVMHEIFVVHILNCHKRNVRDDPPLGVVPQDQRAPKVLPLLRIGSEGPETLLLLLLQEPLFSDSQRRRRVYPKCLELRASYLAYEPVMSGIHRVIFGADVTLPVPFHVATCDEFALLPVSATEFFRVIGDVDLAILDISLRIED